MIFFTYFNIKQRQYTKELENIFLTLKSQLAFTFKKLKIPWYKSNTCNQILPVKRVINTSLSVKEPRGVLPYERLMGMYAGWGRIFPTVLTIIGSHFQWSY